MSQKSKQKLAKVLRPYYQKAGRDEKSRILDKFMAVGYHRKYWAFSSASGVSTNNSPRVVACWP